MSIDTMCPDPDKVARLMSGVLPEAEVDEICEHVMTCTACTTILRTASHDSELPQVALPGPAPWIADPEDFNVIEQLIASLQALPLHRKLRENATEIEATVNLNELSQQLLRPRQSAMEMGWLGPYRVLGILGAGGMGVVFEAEDPRLGRQVAIKAMQPGLLHREEHRLRFLREARTAASLDHDNIVPIHHVG